jgi:23S rRNA (cytosine1962-C5)-methyltransferase
MTTYPIITLRPEKDVHLRNRHHAIFQNAVAKSPTAGKGEIVEVHSATGDFLCYATWNTKAYICGRAFAFEKSDPLAQLQALIERSVALRKHFFAGGDTTAYRLVNAEGDSIPGLIVDLYADTIVIQLTTLGMDVLRDWVVTLLRKATGINRIYEKSSGPARKKEGLDDREGWILGSGDTKFPVTERGMTFMIDLAGAQKTGLFLDQREMRTLVSSVSKGRTVLDVCSYVGGFSLAALRGGALAADAVDYDSRAIERVREHMALNGFTPEQLQGYPRDAFDFLKQRPLPRAYDFIVLDPPAFAKTSSHIDQAKRAYTDLNRLAMQILPKGGLLLTCSCSYQVDHQLFQTIVFHAARQAGRSVRILHRHRQAFDHPVNLFHPEVDYLKSLLLWVE